MESRGSKFWKYDTMKFFGDTIWSFALKEWNGQLVLYRKPESPINVFGDWTVASKAIEFNSWYVVGEDCKVVLMNGEETGEFYESLE